MPIGVFILLGLMMVCFFSLLGFKMYLDHKEYMAGPKKANVKDGIGGGPYFYSKTTKKTKKEAT